MQIIDGTPQKTMSKMADLNQAISIFSLNISVYWDTNKRQIFPYWLKS